MAAQVVSGPLPCNSIGTAGSHLAVDEGGGLHALMVCSTGMGGLGGSGGTGGRGGTGGTGGTGGSAGSPGRPEPPPAAPNPGPGPSGFELLIASSDDGGRTFRAPVFTGLQAFDAQVAGGEPGVVVVVAVGPLGLLAARSEDGGATWQAPTELTRSGGNPRLAAAGQQVFVTAQTDIGPQLWLSQDGGKTFRSINHPDPARPTVVGLGIDAGTGHLWMLTGDGAMVVRRSQDGGASFDVGTTIAQEPIYHAFAAGPGSYYAVGKDPRVLIVPRDGSPRREVGGLLDALLFARFLLADAQDNLIVLESDSGVVQARRLPAGASAFQPAKTFGMTAFTPSAVALSDSAIAVAVNLNGRISVAVETWP